MASKNRLSIAIPAYGRMQKVQRLLSQIETQIIKYNLFQDVEVLVSSNGNIDGNKLYVDKKINYSFHENEYNLGYDLNVLQCVRLSNFEYVWLFGSDDNIEADTLLDLVSYLKIDTDVLLLPFRQPEIMAAPSKEYSLNLSEVNMDKKLYFLFITGKITSYVLKRKNLKLDILDTLKPEKEHGWMHIFLALTALKLGNQKLDAYSKFMAFSLDAEAKKIDYIPVAFKNYNIFFSHPMCDQLSKRIKKDVAKKFRFTEIFFIYKVLNRSWDSPIRDEYIEYFKIHRKRLFSLHPKTLFVFVMSLLYINAK